MQRPIILRLLAIVAASGLTGAAAACSDRPGDLCSVLAEAPNCNGETQSKCEAAIASAQDEAPACAPLVDALAECIAGLRLECTGPDSISANGDGEIGGGQNFTDVGGYSVVVNDSECDAHRRGLEACRTCPDAVGATMVDVLGVGDRCDTGTCAAGLSCQGICTRSCSEDSECAARADGCQLQVQYPNVCNDDGMCTRSCGGDYECQAWVGPASTCSDGACTVG